MHDEHDPRSFEVYTPDDVARLDDQLDAWRLHASPAPPVLPRRFELPPGLLIRAGAVVAVLGLVGVGAWSATWSTPAAAPGPSASSTPGSSVAAFPPLPPPSSSTSLPTRPTPPPTSTPSPWRSTPPGAAPSATPSKPAKTVREQPATQRTERPRTTPERPSPPRADPAPRGRRVADSGPQRVAKRPDKSASTGGRRATERPPSVSAPLTGSRVCGDRFPRNDLRYAACLSFWQGYRQGLNWRQP